MFQKEDNTYNDIREKSLMQWLDSLEQHEDIAVRTGVTLAKEYLGTLQRRNENLEHMCQIKDTYLMKLQTQLQEERSK